MSSSKEKSSRIAKNTIFLYLRSIVTLMISLYTSRVVLATLGVEDYGVYVVVGGVVAMFSSFSGALSSAISRFLTYELGRGSGNGLNKVFSTSVLIQLLLAGVIVLFVLMTGNWFLNTKLNIPVERLDAAHWVLVCSTVTLGIGLISIAYNAMIIAHEHMKAFAYIGMFDVLLRLVAVFLLTSFSFDSLKLYAVLVMAVSITIQLISVVYCRMNFSDSRIKFVWDKSLIKEMSSFAGWAFFSSSIGMMNTQGINILMNMYFGVATNAARGIAMQVETSLTQFIGNFTTAMNPQVVKSYAAGDNKYMFQLICSGSKLAYFMALFFIVPLFIEADTVLHVWLDEVPEYAVVFLRLTLLVMLPQVLAGILFTAAMATGKIRTYALVVNGVSVFVFIFAWVLYYLGFSAETAYIVHFLMRVVLIGVRLLLLKNMIGLSPMLYVRTVVLKIIPVSILSFSIPLLALLLPIEPSFWRVVLITIISVPTTVIIISLIGITKEERFFVTEKFKLLKKKFVKGHK